MPLICSIFQSSYHTANTETLSPCSPLCDIIFECTGACIYLNACLSLWTSSVRSVAVPLSFSIVFSKPQNRNIKVQTTKKASFFSPFYCGWTVLPLLDYSWSMFFQRTHLHWMSSVCVCVCDRVWVFVSEMYKCESLDLKLHKPSMYSLRGTCVYVCVCRAWALMSTFHPNVIEIVPVLLNLGLLYWFVCCMAWML